MIALLLDLANIAGGFLLAVPLLRGLPQIGDDVARTDRAVQPVAWVVGVIALVAGGYYLIVHLTSGPHVFHFEVIGIGVGIALLWDRLTGRARPQSSTLPSTGPHSPSSAVQSSVVPGTTVQGTELLLAVFGLIAIVVGIQGVFTPN